MNATFPVENSTSNFRGIREWNFKYLEKNSRLEDWKHCEYISKHNSTGNRLKPIIILYTCYKPISEKSWSASEKCPGTQPTSQVRNNQETQKSIH